MWHYDVVLWIDDVRTPPMKDDKTIAPCRHVIWCKSVNEAIAAYILWNDPNGDHFSHIAEISLDHDAGDYASAGGDYIKFLDWLEEFHADEIPNIKWEIHSMNAVGLQNMRRILRKNGVNI